MTDNTDGALVDELDIGSFEFDNCGLDSIDDLLNDISEADLYESVSSLPPSCSILNTPSDFQVAFSRVSHGTTVSPSLVSAAPPRNVRYPVGQMLQAPCGQNTDVKDCAALTNKTSGVRSGHGMLNSMTNSGNRHRSPVVPGATVELQTYVDNQVDDSLLNFYHLKPSGTPLPGKANETLGLIHHPLQHNLHYPHHAVQREIEFLPPDARLIHQRIHGAAPRNGTDTQSRLCNVRNFHSDCQPDDVDSKVFSEQVADDILDILMDDQEEMNRILCQIANSSGGQLNQMLSPGSEGQLHQILNQQYPTSSANTGMQNGVTAMSSYPDTPPESGSEAHSPPDNLPVSMGPDVSSNGVIPGGSFCRVSAAPGSRPNLPPYHSSHVTAPGNVAGSIPPHHPAYMTATSGSNNNQPAMATLDPQLLLTDYNRGSLSHKSKKRKHSISPQSTITSSMVNALTISTISANMPVQPVSLPVNLPIKPEPVMVSDGSEDDTCGFENQMDGNNGSYQVIKWTNHMPSEWSDLVDESGLNPAVTSYQVDADKGFNFSSTDEAFVCQKKNHFQVTVHVSFSAFPRFIRSADNDLQKVDDFYLNFHGIKMESPNQKIKVEQSQSDRSKRPLHPVRVDFGSPPQQLMAKAVIGRLHFSETTTNNMRKRGKPNPDQRYFQLVVSLVARSGSKDFLISAQVSERIIVRASNPGQFDGDVDSPWNKGKGADSIFHMGNVGVNVENPDEALTVHGNIKLTGHVLSPSDVRAKSDLKQLDTSQQLKNISQINVYHYRYNEMFAKYAGLDSGFQTDTGVLAQEVSEILPDAVQEVGDVLLPDGEKIEKFLVVNKDRIFIEGIGAVKELCKVTDKLEDRINEIEVVNKRLKKYGYNRESIKSTQSNISTCSTVSRSDNAQSPTSPGKLNSSRLSPPHHHHHCRHHRHHQNSEEISQKGEKGLCSNRVVQVIIVILVLIMALCLVAITLLYVLEMVSSNENVSANPSPPPGGSNNSGITNTTAEIPDYSSTAEMMYDTSQSPSTTGEPLLWPDCLSDDCPVVHCCLPETTAATSYFTDADTDTSMAGLTESWNGRDTAPSVPALLSTSRASSSANSGSTAVSSANSTQSKLSVVPFVIMVNTEGVRTSPSSTSENFGSSRSASTAVIRDLSDRPDPQSGTSYFQSTTDAAGGTGPVNVPASPLNPYSTRSGSPSPVDPGGQYGPVGPPGGQSSPPGPVGSPGLIGPPSGPSDTIGVPGPYDGARPEIVPDSSDSPGLSYWRSNFASKQRRSSEQATPWRPSSFSSNARTVWSSATSNVESLSKATVSDGFGSTQDPYPKYNVLSQSASSLFRVILDDSKDGTIDRKRRDADLVPRTPLADIYVKLGNETRNLTVNYCSSGCRTTQQGSTLFYNIPLASAFPRLPVRLEFANVSSDKVDQVALCNANFVWNCNSTDADETVTTTENSENEWLLPVGMFLSSTYVFRIPLALEAGDEVCEEPDSSAGTTFQGYTFTFFRLCYIQK